MSVRQRIPWVGIGEQHRDVGELAGHRLHPFLTTLADLGSIIVERLGFRVLLFAVVEQVPHWPTSEYRSAKNPLSLFVAGIYPVW
jgi:hypothetical protein